MDMHTQLKFSLDHNYYQIQQIQEINSHLIYSWTLEVAGPG